MANPKPLSALLPLIKPHLPACPDIVGTLNLRLAAIEYCERTRCWRHLTTQALTARNPAVALPGYAALHVIEHATLDGESLTPVAFTDAARDLALGGEPRYVTQSDDGRIRVLPFPEEADEPPTLTLSLFLKPRLGRAWTALDGESVDAYDMLPEPVMQTHGEGIAWGALARLYMQTGESWAEPKLGQLYRAMFEARMDERQDGSITGQQRAPLRTVTSWV